MGATTRSNGTEPLGLKGVALFYRFPKDAPPEGLVDGTAMRALGGYGLLLGLHAIRPRTHRAWLGDRLTRVDHRLEWRLAVTLEGRPAWHTLRTVVSAATWRRFWPSGPELRGHFRIESELHRLRLSITREDEAELELEARHEAAPGPGLLRRRQAEAELFEEPGGSKDLLRGPLALEPMRLERAACPWLESRDGAVPDSVFRLVDRRLVGESVRADQRREGLSDTRPAPILPTPS